LPFPCLESVGLLISELDLNASSEISLDAQALLRLTPVRLAVIVLALDGNDARFDLSFDF